MSIQQTLIQEKLNDIVELQKVISKLENTPIDVVFEQFPSQNVNCYNAIDITIVLPFRFELIQEVKNFMAEAISEYTLESESQDVYQTYAEHVLKYFPENTKIAYPICVVFRTNIEGTTCVLNQIGTQVIPAKEVPIMEVICQAGAEEGTFDEQE